MYLIIIFFIIVVIAYVLLFSLSKMKPEKKHKIIKWEKNKEKTSKIKKKKTCTKESTNIRFKNNRLNCPTCSS